MHEQQAFEFGRVLYDNHGGAKGQPLSPVDGVALIALLPPYIMRQQLVYFSNLHPFLMLEISRVAMFRHRSAGVAMAVAAHAFTAIFLIADYAYFCMVLAIRSLANGAGRVADWAHLLAADGTLASMFSAKQMIAIRLPFAVFAAQRFATDIAERSADRAAL